MNVPRIHNLLRLYNKISELINFIVDEDELEKTDEVYTETRYPSDIGMLPDGKPSIKEAKNLYNFANYIFKETNKTLKSNKL